MRAVFEASYGNMGTGAELNRGHALDQIALSEGPQLLDQSLALSPARVSELRIGLITHIELSR
jgi:hypothetical protein